jgi:DUF1707 SHOCT-like domain
MSTARRTDGLRLSDAEREEAARALGEHYAEGRLTLEEHSERVERAYAARTRGDLPTLFADLPGGSPVRPGPRYASTPDQRRAGAVARPRTWRPPLWRFGLLRAVALVLLLAFVAAHTSVILIGIFAACLLMSLRARRRWGRSGWPAPR